MEYDSGKFEQRHRTLRDRPRRVIFNNDGCDVFTVSAESEPTAGNLLAQRSSGLADTHVDVMVYTTISSGFSLFTHATHVGEVLHRPHPALNNNIAPALIEQGRDCLQIMVDFGHAKGMEVFWSMRMNDTHDGAHRPDKPYFLFPRLKQQHPEYLMGTPEERPRHGSWSAVDYGHPEIRELAFRFVEEVCQRYDVDGVELDFFRHPVFFRRVAAGEPAAPEDCEAMTGLLRRIRAMCRKEGERRGRPLLLAVRTPDSFEYGRLIGLDVGTWMAEGLFDFWIPSGYFRLNPWSYSVERAHHQDIKVWAGMSESRVGGGHHRHAGRASDPCYRGRALNAWEAGADGVYLFNLFDPQRRVWHELGDPSLLQTLKRRYFVSVLGRKNAAGGNYPCDGARNLPVLNPDDPVEIPDDRIYETNLTLSGIPHNVSPAKQAAYKVQLIIELDRPVALAGDVQLILNGISLPAGRSATDALCWEPDVSQLRNGENLIGIRRKPASVPLRVCDISAVVTTI